MDFSPEKMICSFEENFTGDEFNLQEENRIHKFLLKKLYLSKWYLLMIDLTFLGVE